MEEETTDASMRARDAMGSHDRGRPPPGPEAGALGPMADGPLTPPPDGTAPPAGLSRLLPVGCVDPATIEVHPYADLLPRMTPSQRAAVAALLFPHIAEDVHQERIEKLRETSQRRYAGQALPRLVKTEDAPQRPVSAHTIAAHIMRVSRGYVIDACRVQRDAPDLSEQVRSGAVSLQDALRRLDGVVDGAAAREIRSTRRRLNRIPAVRLPGAEAPGCRTWLLWRRGRNARGGRVPPRDCTLPCIERDQCSVE